MDALSDIGTAQGEQYPIYLGIWTNWSHGRVMGATLTLRQSDANLLVAFTAFFIAFVAVRFWIILCFVLHRLYSTSNAQDVIYHQRQAILRNSSSPEHGVWLLLQLLWASRNSKRPFRPVFATLIAILSIGAFTTAGGFSSRIFTTINNEALLRSVNCGYPIHSPNPESPSYFSNTYDAEAVNNALNYAQQCYSTNSADLLDCGRFVTPKIAGNVNRTAGCPFKQEMCQKNSSNIWLDTGYIDSHNDLGLNTPENERILWRNVLHCAPLVTKGFTSHNMTPHGNLTFYMYGTTTGFRENITYSEEAVETQISRVLSPVMVVTSGNYRLQSFSAYMKDKVLYKSISGMQPIESLRLDNEDLYLFFLSGNGVIFLQPTEEDWYRTAEKPIDITSFSGNQTDRRHTYAPQEPASPLACTDKYQFCRMTSKDNRTCDPLTSFRDAIGGAASLFDSSYAQQAKVGTQAINITTPLEARWLYFTTIFDSAPRLVYDIIRRLGPTALQSQRTLMESFQGPLEKTQWQLDVIHWWDISRAATQAAFINAVYGPTDPAILLSRSNFTAPFTQLCDSQKIRSTAYASLSVFGLCFTFIVGTLIALTSYLLEPISVFFHNKEGRSPYAHLEWTTNATLQLQRLAYEEAHLGTWSRCTDAIPTTKPDELLGCLDTTDLKHPVLQRLREKQDSLVQAQGSNEATEAIVENNTQQVEASPTQAEATTPVTMENIQQADETTPAWTGSSTESLEGAAEVSPMAIEPQASDVLDLADHGAVDSGAGSEQARDLSTEAAVTTKGQNYMVYQPTTSREAVHQN